MIQEHIVSFEIAKRLKELGFSEDVGYYYPNDSYHHLFRAFQVNNYNATDDRISAPTVQMAWEWIFNNGFFIWMDINKPKGFIYVVDTEENTFFKDKKYWPSYREALEDAMEYTLNELWNKLK